MSLSTRNIRLVLREQIPQKRVLYFYPQLTGADGELLLNEVYEFTVYPDGHVDDTDDNLIVLPVKSTGNLGYRFKIPKFGTNQFSEGLFNLSAGSEIDFDELLTGGQEATDSIKDYIDEKVGELGPGGALVINEIPSGTINGSNANFTTQFEFVPETVDVKVNGLTQKIIDDFNTSGTQTIILTTSPHAGESILVTYLRG